MSAYLARRLLLSIPTVLVVSLVVFFIFRLLPGDVALNIVTEGGTASLDTKRYAEVRHELGLDRPVIVQYGAWLSDMVRLEGGKSLVSGRPVFQELAQSIPVTLELAAFSLIIALLVAIPVGVLSAIRQNSPWDYLGRLFTTVGLAMPSFLAGAMLILFFVLFFEWLPPLEYKSLLEDPLSNLNQMIWPALTLGYGQSAILARMTRSSMLEVLRQDYVRTARAKGLHSRVVVGRHALRNAFLPLVTIAGIQAAHLLSGAVIVEAIFVLPGIGTQLIDGIRLRDWVTVQTIVALFAVMILFLNVFLDLLYGLLDPRIRYQS